MNIKQRLISCCFMLLFTGAFTVAAFGQSQALRTNQFINQLVLKLQIKKDLTGPEEGMGQLLKKNFLKLPVSNNQKLQQVFTASYAGEMLLKTFKDSLRQQLSPDIRSSTMAWLKQSSTQAVLQVNQQNNTLQGKRKRVVALYEVDEHAPKAKRKQVLSTLWDATDTFRRSVNLPLIMFRSLIEAYGNLSGNQFGDERIDAIVQNYKQRALLPSVKEAQKHGSRTLAVKYYNVNTSDIKAYASFFETEAGQKLVEAISKSMEAAYHAGAQRLLDQIK